MITIVTAPEHVEFPQDSIKIFLAGGIQHCDLWQEKIINMFKHIDIDKNIYILNPRRDNFPIDDPNVAEEQITWEFEMLEQCDYFTMLFLSSTSHQPICFYELGRNIERMKQRFPIDWKNRIIISSDEKFLRVQDVEIQTKLATNGDVHVNITPDYNLYKTHFESIITQLNKK